MYSLKSAILSPWKSMLVKYRGWFFAGACFMLILIVIQPGHPWGDDFALYIEQAISIKTGHLDELYSKNRLAMELSAVSIGPYLYPPGYPVLLIPAYLLAGVNLGVFKLYTASFLILCIPVFFGFFRGKLNAWALIFQASFFFFHREVIQLGDWILSDLPFTFFSLLSFFAMQQANTTPRYLLTGFLFFVSFMIRDIGICLLPAYFCHQLVSREHTSLRSYLPYLVFMLSWLLTAMALPPGSANHIMLLQQISAGSVLENALCYSRLYADFVLNLPFLQLSFLLMLVTLWGVWVRRKSDLALVCYLVLYMLVLLLWPMRQGIRFLVPVLPFLLYFLVQGLLQIKEKLRIGDRLSNTAFLLFVPLFFAANTWKIARDRQISSNESYDMAMQKMYGCIREQVPENAVIGFYKPRALRLFTGRNAAFVSPGGKNSDQVNYFLVDRHIAVPGNFRRVCSAERLVLIEKITDRK